MAEALWRHEAGDRYEVASAGVAPCWVHPMAKQVIEELGIDMSRQFSKSVYPLAASDYDLIVTVCDTAAQYCPTFTGAKQLLHWPFEDPISATGTDQERIAEFRRVRDVIHARIREFLNSVPC